MFIQQDKFDGFLYKDTRNANPGIPALENKGMEKLPVWPEVVKDLWAGMFKQSPEFSPDANGALAKAMQDVMQTKEWQNLRHHTRLDEVGSAIGTTTFGNEFYDNLPEEVFATQKAQDEQKVLQDTLDLNNEDQKGLEEENKDLQEKIEKTEDQKQKDQLQQQIEKNQQQQAQIQQQNQKLQQQVQQKQKQIKEMEEAYTKGHGEGMEATIRRVARKAGEKAANETATMKDFIQQWGDTAGEGGKVPTLKEQMELARKIQKDKKFRKVVELVGRMKRMVESIQAKKVDRTPEEIVDVETGRELQSLLPSQFSLLNNPLTKLEFYRQYEERSLLQYKKQGTERAGKGPIVVMVDESGSMDGDRILWAKAVGLALAHLAKKQRRTIVLGGFSSGGQVWTERFEKGKISAKEIDKYLKQFYAGGTDYDMALNRCMKEVKEIKQEKADVVFISDGDCYMSESNKKKFNSLKKEMGFRVFGIGVDVGTESFEDFCDISFSISGDINSEGDIALDKVFAI